MLTKGRWVWDVVDWEVRQKICKRRQKIMEENIVIFCWKNKSAMFFTQFC